MANYPASKMQALTKGFAANRGKTDLLTETPGQLTAGLSSQYQLSPWKDAVTVSLLSAHKFSIKFTGTQYLKDLDLSYLAGTQL